MTARGFVSALASVLGAALLTATPARAQVENWAVASARTLTAQGDAEAAAGHADAAARRYLDALAIDASHRAAYLGLGRAREAIGDVREAARVYGAGIERVPAFWEAEVARAHLRKRIGDRDGAESDLRTAIADRPGDRALQEELAGWRVERGAWPEALGVFRSLAATARDDASEQRRLRGKIKALRLLAAELDTMQSRARVRSDRAGIEAAARRRAE